MRRPNLDSYQYRYVQSGLHSFSNLLFICAICERDVRDEWGRQRRNAHQWPLCKHCERTWGSQIPNMTGLDRRCLAQLKALASALECDASISLHRSKQ